MNALATLSLLIGIAAAVAAFVLAFRSASRKPERKRPAYNGEQVYYAITPTAEPERAGKRRAGEHAWTNRAAEVE